MGFLRGERNDYLLWVPTAGDGFMGLRSASAVCEAVYQILCPI